MADEITFETPHERHRRPLQIMFDWAGVVSMVTVVISIIGWTSKYGAQEKQVEINTARIDVLEAESRIVSRNMVTKEDVKRLEDKLDRFIERTK